MFTWLKYIFREFLFKRKSIITPEKSTYFVFDGAKIVISPDLMSVFKFLEPIENETSELLNFHKRLKEIRDHFREYTGLILAMAEKLKENNLEINYKFSHKPEALIEKLKIPNLERVVELTFESATSKLEMAYAILSTCKYKSFLDGKGVYGTDVVEEGTILRVTIRFYHR